MRWISYLYTRREQRVLGTVCFCERFRQIHQSVTHNGVDGGVGVSPGSMRIAVLSSPTTCSYTVSGGSKREME